MCMSPLELYWIDGEQKYSVNYNPKYCSGKRIIVPCGRCPECKKKWRTQLAQRVRYEISKYSYNELCFVTLTVNNDMIDEVFPNGSLDHAYFQKFIKRLRRRLDYHQGKRIKYLVAGEYGEKEGRPHFHMILFGWKPTDMKYRGKSKKGYKAYKSEFLESVWGAGFVDVGDVDEHTAPYMVKYITKFSEIKKDEFVVNGKNVRKPYLVYPKKILGLDYFLDNYEQILNNGYVLDSRGQKCGIPKSFLKYAEKCDDLYLNALYEEYKERMEIYAMESYKEIIDKYDLLPIELHGFLLEQGRVRREIYNSFKNVNR